MIETKQMDTTEIRSFGNKIYNSKEGSPFWFSEGKKKEQSFPLVKAHISYSSKCFLSV